MFSWHRLPYAEFGSLHDGSLTVKHLRRKQLAMRIARQASVVQKFYKLPDIFL
jgi:hypothetical protein